MSDGMNKSQYARHRGVSRGAVSKALRDGRISTGPDGLIDPRGADADWLANTAARVNSQGVTPPEAVKPRRELSDAGVPGYSASRARREAANAEMAELERDRLRGLLVDADQVRSDAFMAARTTRNMLQAIPARVSAILAGETDEKKIYRMLEEAIDDACRSLADKVEAATRH